MEVKVPRGKYVLAVSGGVDSMALLDLLAKQAGLSLVVAHFNHGIRPEAGKDEALVARRAKRLKLAFEAGHGKLGKIASEETARNARYEFLNRVKSKHRAEAVITAHHQDDLIETALINILRGTGRRGLTAISDNKQILRPLLGTPKAEIIEYSQTNHLQWREDTTNSNPDYLRNYIRIKLMPKLSVGERQKFISNNDKVAKTNKIIDIQIATLSQELYKNKQIHRQSFAALPNNIAEELLVYWLKQERAGEFDRKTVSRLNLALRTARPGSTHPIKGVNMLVVSDKTAKFTVTPKNQSYGLL